MAGDDGEEDHDAGSPSLGGVLSSIAAAANAVRERDAAAREDVRVLSDRLIEEARQAHVYATSETFDLVEDTYGQGHGVYGHLAVGPRGFYLATRTEMEDIMDRGLAPDGDKLYSTMALVDWPVEWLRLIVDQGLMAQLARALLQSMNDHLANPAKGARLPADMQPPAPAVVSVATELDFPKVVEGWREAQREKLTNPASALRIASVLLETVCKHVLQVCSAEEPPNPTLPKLYRVAAQQLGMDADEQRLATGLRSVVDGIAHGRSHLSNAHGAGPEDDAPAAEHVELAVAASGVLSVHLMKLLAKRRAAP